MNKEIIKGFLDIENKLLSNPRTFFKTFEAGYEARSNLIWNEYLEWQDLGGKPITLEIKEIENDILYWNIGGDEWMAQKIDKFAPFSKEEYKQALIAVFSFMKDRPQYFKFRKMDGMFNPLKLLLYRFL